MKDTMTPAYAASCARASITWIHFISSSVKQQGTLASTMGTATTTPQIKNLIGRIGEKNNRVARAARAARTS